MSVITGRQAIAQNALLPVAGLLALGLFILLYAIDKPLYLHLIGLWFPRVSRFPFMDADIGAQIGCWQRGVDVYAADPCDLLQRPFGYSPFWLRMWFLPSNLAWNNVLGIAQAAIFALSLAVLPKTPGRMPTVVMLLALLSPVTVFGVERSNPDLFMFVLAGLMVLCLERGMALRLCGYGAAALGGALKFYPVVLLLLVARERARTCLILAAIGLAAIVTFFLAYRTELVRMMPNLPRPAPFEYSLGATQLGEGLGLVTGHSWLGTWLFVILLSCCATGVNPAGVAAGFQQRARPIDRAANRLPAGRCGSHGRLFLRRCQRRVSRHTFAVRSAWPAGPGAHRHQTMVDTAVSRHHHGRITGHVDQDPHGTDRGRASAIMAG